MVSFGIHFTAGFSTNDEMFYLWVAFYAFNFLSVRLAAAQLLLAGTAYALVLALRHVPMRRPAW